MKTYSGLHEDRSIQKGYPMIAVTEPMDSGPHAVLRCGKIEVVFRSGQWEYENRLGRMESFV